MNIKNKDTKCPNCNLANLRDMYPIELALTFGDYIFKHCDICGITYVPNKKTKELERLNVEPLR